MNLRTGLGGIALLSVCMAGCVFDDDSSGAAGSGAAAVHLQPAGSEQALAAHINAGRNLNASGDLQTQRMVGAPAMFVGAEVRDTGGFVPAAGGGGAVPGGVAAGAADALGSPAGGVMAGNESTPADDGLNNVQVAGVEEPDLVKSDGEYLYVAEQPDQWIYRVSPGEVVVPDESLTEIILGGGPATRARAPRDGISLGLFVSDKIPGGEVVIHDSPRIARYRLDSTTPGATALDPLVLTGTTGYMSQMSLLLAGGDTPRLVAMGQSGNDWRWDRWFSAVPYAVTQETRLWVFDTSNPEDIGAPLANLTLKGELVNSRRIGNHLYLVTRYSPTPGTDPLVPQVTLGASERPLVPPGDCLVPEGDEGFPSLTFIVAVDLENPAASKASCYAGEVYTLYMSQEALYLAAQRYNAGFDWGIGTRPVPVARGSDVPAAATAAESNAADAPVNTVIHRFALNDGDPEYTGSGMVAGGFTGWMGTGSQPQWRFHERNGLLYVVTSWWDYDDLHHHLYVLAPDDDGDLVVAGMLPNAAHPEPIGHVREDIFAMRYVGERAYVVTFRQTDPLYVIDLSDARNPVLAGELELPGFSAYLHPIGDDWLLGIGRGAAGGIEANLFDVRDPQNPQVQGNLVICTDCNAPLLTDYHAIAVQRRDDGVTRVALPLQRWATAELTWSMLEQAALLEVTQASGLLSSPGVMDASAEYTALGRVLLIADAIFQPQNGAVSVGRWPAAPAVL